MGGVFAVEALRYLAAGANVLPIVPGMKAPPHGVTWKRWQTDEQTSEEVERLIRAHPTADIAIVLGKVSDGLVDIETDGASGERALRDLGLPLPPTAAFDSTRGRHRLYRSPQRVPTRLGLRSRLDVLAEGHYVVVPPSGDRRWLTSGCLEEVTFLPEPWREVLRRAKRPETDSSGRTADRGQGRSFNHDTAHARGANDQEPQEPEDRKEASPEYSGLASFASVLPQVGAFEGDVWRRVATRLGLPIEIGTAFRCPLPGHEESRASAALYVAQNGEVVLHDFHKRSGQEFFTLVDVYMALQSGRVRRLRGPEHAVWSRRLQVELGLLQPVPVPFPPLPDNARRRDVLRRAYEGIRLLFGVRWLGTHGAAAPLVWSFLSEWCGIGERQAGEAIHELLRLGVIHIAGKYRRLTLFLPGSVEGTRVCR